MAEVKGKRGMQEITMKDARVVVLHTIIESCFESFKVICQFY